MMILVIELLQGWKHDVERRRKNHVQDKLPWNVDHKSKKMKWYYIGGLEFRYKYPSGYSFTAVTSELHQANFK